MRWRLREGGGEGGGVWACMGVSPPPVPPAPLRLHPPASSILPSPSAPLIPISFSPPCQISPLRPPLVRSAAQLSPLTSHASNEAVLG